MSRQCEGILTHDPTGLGLLDLKGHYHVVQYLERKKYATHVPFLYNTVLECDSNGVRYVNSEHEIAIRVSEGAVMKGKVLHLEVAITMYGPFKFPENTQPISPILWICFVEIKLMLN